MNTQFNLLGVVTKDIVSESHPFNSVFRDEISKNFKTDGYRATIQFDSTTRLSPAAQTCVVGLKRKFNTFAKTIVQGRLFIDNEVFKDKESRDAFRVLLSTVSCMLDVGAVSYIGNIKIKNIKMLVDDVGVYAEGWKVFLPSGETLNSNTAGSRQSYEAIGIKTHPASDALVNHDIFEPSGRVVSWVDPTQPWPNEPGQATAKCGWPQKIRFIWRLWKFSLN